MPKLIAAIAAFLLKRHLHADDVHNDPLHKAMHARTRTREATRRLREYRVHDAYVDLGPLKLTRRH